MDLAPRWSAPATLWPSDEALEIYGLASQDGQIVPIAPHDPLSPSEIRSAISSDILPWLRDLRVMPVVGSTNAEMMALAQHSSIDGAVWLAEVQLQGRGRRGRTWFSPFGANLALSIGVAIPGPAAALGGASLVVGLAVIDALDQLEVVGLSLKWPNDVLLSGAKLGGILIEMTNSGSAGVQLVVGIGLNIVLPAHVRANLPQAVADLRGGGNEVRRSVIAGRLVSSVVQFLEHFAECGFGPFARAFDARHHFHGQQVTLLHGEETSAGRVAGVSAEGGLLLQMTRGTQEFHGGEVSMRQTPGA
jgi:BirA family transcriptional regulator, biotin operon repressor / biotin---[acetyl-CoA-carboxylase] ligase